VIRVAIADEHRLVRWALHQALADLPDIEVVGEAGTVSETLAMIQHVEPDVLLLDPAVPDHSGFDVLAAIRELQSAPLVIILAAHTEVAFAARTIAAGAHGFLDRDATPEKLLEAIHDVSRGEQVLPLGVHDLVASGEVQPTRTLTRREQEVMEMLGRGMTSREIAEHLQISIKTVDTHRGHVLKKLGLRNNAEIARFAVKHGYVTL
jgi:DNA-binding NarL/FixJ family response regulator